MKIQIEKILTGSILDIGGGGEGIIGQVYKDQVTAIDTRQDELDEAPEGFKKILMDASKMSFEDASFDNITSFYSFMYMSKTVQEKVINEVSRVLRNEGKFFIWDVNINSAEPKPFLVDLDIDANGNPIHTTYGIIKSEAKQDASYFIELCKNAQLQLVELQENEGNFNLCFMK